MLEVSMKEEGEISDDDDDDKQEMAEKAKPPENEVSRYSFNRQYQRAADRYSLRHDTQRSSDFQKSRSTMTKSPSASRRPRQNLKARPNSRTLVPPSASHFTHSRPPLLPLPSQPPSRFPIPLCSQVTANINSEFDHEKLLRQQSLQSQKSPPSSSYKVHDISDEAEVIIIDDSDADLNHDTKVFESEIKPEDDDLDELELRHQALASAMKFNKNQRDLVFAGNAVSLLDSERDSSNHIQLHTVSTAQNLPDVFGESTTVQPDIEQRLNASDNTGGTIVPVAAGNDRLQYEKTTSNKPSVSQDYALIPVPSHQESSVTWSDSLNAELLEDLTYAETNSIVPVPPENLAVDVDNYDQVEMELDSGSDSVDVPLISTCDAAEPPSDWISDVTSNAVDENVPVNQDAFRLQASLESASISMSLPMSEYSTSNIAVSASSPSSVPYVATDDSSNAAMQQVVEGIAAPDDRMVRAKTETVESSAYVFNLQQQRRAKDADKKELLLRAAVLQSLSSKRQQQKQSDGVSSTLRDRAKVAKLQVGAQSIKRTVTPASGNQLTVQLPFKVHQPVVISLTGESSESDDDERLEVADSYDPSSIAAPDSSLSSARLGSNVDKVLREIRRATEAPKSQDSDIAPVAQTKTTSAVQRQENHTISEPTVANQSSPLISVSSSLPFLTCEKKAVPTKSPAVSFNEGVTDLSSVQVEAAKDNLLQKTAVNRVQRELAFERRKLQQQKIYLSKTKLKTARKKEQVGAAEKRVKRLREQLLAAEKIAASSKKQLDSMREETSSLTRGIVQQQKTVGKLEADLRTAQQNLTPSVDRSASNLENFLLTSENLSAVNPQSSVIKLRYRLGSSNAVQGTSSGHVSAATSGQRQSFSCTTTNDVLGSSRLFTSQASQSSLSAELSSTKQTKPQESNSALMTFKASLPQRIKTPAHLNASESDTVLVANSDKLAKTAMETEAKRNAADQSLTGTTSSHTVDCVSAEVSEESPVNQGLDILSSSITKPCISTAKSDILNKPKSGAPSDGLAVVADDTVGGDICSEFAMPSDKKIGQILHLYNSTVDRNASTCISAPSSQLSISDPVFAFQFPQKPTLLDTASFEAINADDSDAVIVGDSYVPYRSSLRCLRSYRLSGSYKKKEGLSVNSATFSHRLDSRVPLCQFDLTGKCLDDNCRWQHRSDYGMNNRELLVDIVSYWPSVAGITDSTPVSMFRPLLSQYVDRFLKETRSVRLPFSDQCLRLIFRVKVSAGLMFPHAVCTSARRWKPHNTKQYSSAGDKNTDSQLSWDSVSETCVHDTTTGHLSSDDVRYWMLAESDQIQILEEEINNTPADDTLWIKLAYAKMNEAKCSVSHNEYISYGLNVLARAVEENPSNGRLWSRYLDLYFERSDAEKDVSILFEQAVQYAPSYEFFWRYLQLPVGGYSQKMDICKRLRQYLCSPMCRDGADERSHHLLETVLYQAALSTMSGRFKDGLQVIQAIVQSKASVIWLSLTPADRIIMWLSFIHLYETRQLPKTLFDPANNNPGPIVQKRTFTVPFQVGVKTRISYETLVQLFQCAFSLCDKDVDACSDSQDEYIQWLSALHRSRVLLELTNHGWIAACRLCEEVLDRRPYLVDIWLLLVQLIVSSRGNSTEDIGTTVSSTVDRALASCPHSVPLFIAGMCSLLECGDTDSALSFAERCPISLFEVDDLDSTSVDPNLLYCCLLGQPVPPGYISPSLRSTVSREYVADQQANLWLSYALLLDLQGAHEQSTETFHLALGCLTRTKDIERVWIAFLRRSVAVVCRQLPWLSASGSEHRTKLWQQLQLDVDRALVSLPVSRCLPYSARTWDDYSCCNEIIRLQVSCVSDPDVIQDLYEKYLHHMPEIGRASCRERVCMFV